MDARLDAMEAKVRGRLRAQGFSDSQMRTEAFLHLRYEGTDCALMCTGDASLGSCATRHGDFLASFLERQDFIDIKEKICHILICLNSYL